MTRTRVLAHRFVEYIPEQLESGILYVSMSFATGAHLCCCGCGREVVTPFSPTDWQLNFDGESISLEPSIGNWSFECCSHYWIVQNRVNLARRWSQKRIKVGRAHDQMTKQRQFDAKERTRGEQPGGRRMLESDIASVARLWRRVRGKGWKA
jgi:hypothetical protein